MKTFKLYSLSILGAVLFATIINLFFYSEPLDFYSIKMMLFWTTTYTLVLGFGNAYLATVLDKYYDWYSETKLRIWWGIFYTILYSFVGSVFVLVVLLVIPGDVDFVQLFKASFMRRHIYTVILSIIISLFFHLRGFLIEWKAQVKLNEEAKRNQLEAELSSMQKQMDAHFLFNSLSVLREVILEDQQLAAKFVEDFSGVYRYIVQNGSKKTVSLKEELTFIKQYIFLYQTRFEDAIEVNYDLKDCDKEKQVLPLSIQVAIENAIRHNVFSDKSPLKIDITCLGRSIFIKNNLCVKADSKGAGMALKNLEARIGLLSDKNIHIERTSAYYQIEIPLL